MGSLRPAFDHVRTWIFDLDNTLYPASCDLFAEIEVRMGVYIAQLLGVETQEAHEIRARYYREHGTTMAGLMAEHGTDPRHFMRFVHDVNLEILPPNPRLELLLGRLPGRKVVFTNGSAAYAGRVLERLGIGACFEQIFDIEAANFIPKPAPETMGALLGRLGGEPAGAAMFDDIAANLAPAKQQGLTTIWVRGRSFAPDRGTEPVAAPDHITEDLTAFLAESVLAAERADA